MNNVLNLVLEKHESKKELERQEREKKIKTAKIKKIFYDIETTGLDKKTCSIVQFSGCIELDGEIMEYFDFKMKPLPNKVIEEGAMKLMNERGITLDVLNSYPESKIVFKKITELFSKFVNKYNSKDKFFLVGYNNRGFDDDFLRNYWADMGDKFFGSFFWQNTIDVMTLATDYLVECRPNLSNFKLSTVASHLGLDVQESELHDAKYDIDLTYLIYKICKSQIPCDEFIKSMELYKYQWDYGFTAFGYFDYDYVYVPYKERILQIINDWNKPIETNSTNFSSQEFDEDLPF